MTTKEVRDVYISKRTSMTIAEAALETLQQCSVTPSLLVDVFGAGILDFNEDVETMRTYRNELRSYFNDLAERALGDTQQS